MTQPNTQQPAPTQRPQPTTNVVVPVASLAGGQSAAVTRTDAVARLVTGGQWTEADRGFLEGLDDARLGRIAGVQIAAPAPAPAANAAAPQPAVPQYLPQPQQLTTEQYVATLPPDIQRMVRNGLAADTREKQQLVGIITNSPLNRFNPAWLMSRGNDELRGLAALAGGLQPQQPPVANYAGQGEVPMFLEPAAPTGNAAGGEPYGDEPALPIPMFTRADFQAKTA